MLWFPASKLMIPAPIVVVPALFRGTGLAIGGVSPEICFGNVPVSLNVTIPVGKPVPV